MTASIPALCVAAILILASGARADDVRQGKILMLGDSITKGGLPEAVKGPLNELTKGRVVWTLVNAGVNGDTAEGGKARIAALLEAEKPDVVTICYGPNDLAKNMTKPFRDNLLGIIDLIGKRTPAPKIILLTVGPFVDQPPNFTVEGLEQKCNAVTRQVAAEKGLPLVDRYRQFMDDKAWAKYMMPDGVHLNPEGYKFNGPYVAGAIAAWYAGEVAKDPQAVETRDKMVARLKKVAAAASDAASRPEVRLKLLAELDQIWRACPYLPAQGALWHTVWYAGPATR